MPFAARVTDLHLCPMITLVGPASFTHAGGAILGPGASNVKIQGLAASVVGDQAECTGAPPGVVDAIVKGSATVKIAGKPAARMGDMTAHGGTIMMGAPTVNIGG